MPSSFRTGFDPVTNLAFGSLLLLLAFGGWRVLHPSTHFVADGEARWDRAVDMAKTANQPAIVLVTADWCPTCRNLHENVLSRSDVRTELNNYTFFKIDMTNPTPAANARAEKLNVNAYPTLIRYDRDGNETGREHFLTPDAMLAWLRDGE